MSSDCCHPKKTNRYKTYYPLILIFGYLVGFCIMEQWGSGFFNFRSAMIDFMGGFFVVFSFFKFLNLKGFTETYATYDLIANRSKVYAYAYPFIELTLGVAYLKRFHLFEINMVTAALMAVSSLGVIQAISKKSKIQCACLGTVFNLPMSSITLVEDLLMLGMALMGIATQ